MVAPVLGCIVFVDLTAGEKVNSNDTWFYHATINILAFLQRIDIVSYILLSNISPILLYGAFMIITYRLNFLPLHKMQIQQNMRPDHILVECGIIVSKHMPLFHLPIIPNNFHKSGNKAGPLTCLINLAIKLAL